MLIGISGKKQSGKDTSFPIIQKILTNKGFFIKKYHFARYVKEFAELYFGIDQNPVNKEEVRFIWQGIGQLMREEVNKDFWVEKEYQAYLRDKEKSPNLIGIVTDVRYRNEANFFVDKNFPLFRIYRSNYAIEDSHPSEVELDDFTFDYYIDNSSSLDELERKWKKLLTEIL